MRLVSKGVPETMVLMDLDARRLSARFDTLSHPARQWLLAETARSMAGTPALGVLLSELDGQGPIQRRWAVGMAVVAGEQSYLRKCLTSLDFPVAVIALDHCARHGLHYDVIADAVLAAPKAWRQRLYHNLRANRAVDWAESLFPLVRARFGDHEAAAVLPACGAALIAELLPELDFAVPTLVGLARWHPRIVLDHVERRLAETGDTGRGRTWARYGSAVAECARVEPGRVLDLFESLGPVSGLPAGLDRRLAALARADPERLAAILGDRRRQIRFTMGRALSIALRQAGDASLIRLAGGMISEEHRVRPLLRGLPPARRAAILDGALSGRDMLQTGLSISVLDLLVPSARHAHARRLLGTRLVAGDPERRLAITARLPWAQAEPVLRAETKAPTAPKRAAAYELLVLAASATREPETVGRMLGSLTRLANDQDPVRCAALGAIGAVPAWLIPSDGSAAVEKLAADAVQARDTSSATTEAVNHVAMRLIRQGAVSGEAGPAECGLRILRLTARQTLAFSLPNLDRDLPRGAEGAMFATLRPRVDRDAWVGRYEVALALARGLGRRAWAMAELQGYLWQATSAVDDSTARSAIELWLASPAHRDNRVEVLLGRDPSVVVLPAVADVLGGRRTDLLDKALGEPPRGRFVEDGVRVIPSFDSPFGRWLPRQLRVYAGLQVELATEPTVATWERANAVRRLGFLPEVGAAAVRQFLDDSDVSVAETALAALAWTDRPDRELTTLLGYADGDRARAAVYAAVRCARFTPPAELARVLPIALSGRKVTARKEMIRLLAEHRVPGAVERFTGLWADPRTHRDERRAIVSAVRWVLDDARAWVLLGEAATAGPAVALGLIETDPNTVAESHRARYGALVRVLAGAEDNETARLGVHGWWKWSPWDRDGIRVFAELICDFGSHLVWKHAVWTLVTACDATADPAQLHAVVATLSTMDEPAEADRDLPVRQRLSYLVSRLTDSLYGSGGFLRATAGSIAVDLMRTRDYRADGIGLAVAALPDAGDLLEPLTRIAGFADRPALAWIAADHLKDKLSGHRADRPGMLATSAALAGGGPAAAQLAVSVAGQAGNLAGWPMEWRELIALLRGHEDPDVRLRALRTATAEE
jgi:hypothetical protein